MKIFPIRLKPDQDLKESLKSFVIQNNIQSGFILTAVGSLKQATLRFANQDKSQVFDERFEIVSLVGTLSTHGIHLHISLSDQNGKTIGGHLLDGCIIYRTVDETTGYKELEIQPNIREPS
jgi:predicted DNA-binding protein with PD1-like motif